MKLKNSLIGKTILVKHPKNHEIRTVKILWIYENGNIATNWFDSWSLPLIIDSTNIVTEYPTSLYSELDTTPSYLSAQSDLLSMNLNLN